MDASGWPESGFLLGHNMWIGSHFQCADISNRKPLEINYYVIPHAEPTPYDYPPYEMSFVMVLMKHNSTLQEHTHMPMDVSNFIIILELCGRYYVCGINSPKLRNKNVLTYVAIGLCAKK